MASMADVEAKLQMLTKEIELLKETHTEFVATVDETYANVRDLDVSWLVLCGMCVSVCVYIALSHGSMR